MKKLSKTRIQKYLQELSTELGKHNIKGEILIFGGAAMVLAFNARPSTKDVDAIFRPKNEITEISKRIARKYQLPEEWLNDSVKGFLNTDSFQQNLFIRLDNLLVYVPDPEYLLAMKCMSMRIGMESSDIDDVRFLINHLKLKSSRQVFRIIERYYPKNLIPQKTFYAVDEILSQIFGQD